MAVNPRNGPFPLTHYEKTLSRRAEAFFPCAIRANGTESVAVLESHRRFSALSGPPRTLATPGSKSLRRPRRTFHSGGRRPFTLKQSYECEPARGRSFQ